MASVHEGTTIMMPCCQGIQFAHGRQPVCMLRGLHALTHTSVCMHQSALSCEQVDGISILHGSVWTEDMPPLQSTAMLNIVKVCGFDVPG